MNAAAWAGIIPLVLAATVGPWLVGKVNVGRANATVRYVVGAVAVLLMVAAGALARGTFIASWVGFFAGINQWTRLAAACLFIGAVLVSFLAVLPDKWVSVPADQAAAVAGFFAPLLVGYAAWGIGAAAADVLGLLMDASSVPAGWVR